MRAASSVIALVALSGVASADPEMTADKEFQRGRELMKAKRYAEACQAFERSQKLDPQFGTLYNLAQCDVEVGKLASAWAAYRELARADTNADRKVEAATRAKALAPQIPKLIVTSPTHPPGLSITVDGTDVTSLLGIENPLDAGSYTILATAPGFQTYTSTVELVPNQVATTAIRLVPTDAAEDPNTPHAVVMAMHRRESRGKLVALSGGIVATIGLGFGAAAYVENQCDGCDAQKLASQSHRAVILGDVSTAVTAAGLVSLAVGVYLWKTTPHRMIVAPTGTGVALSGVFW